MITPRFLKPAHASIARSHPCGLPDAVVATKSTTVRADGPAQSVCTGSGASASDPTQPSVCDCFWEGRRDSCRSL